MQRRYLRLDQQRRRISSNSRQRMTRQAYADAVNMNDQRKQEVTNSLISKENSKKL